MECLIMIVRSMRQDMNDRAVSVLNNYEFQVLRTWKGRGSILCETDQGIRILKEYNGTADKLESLQRLLQMVKNNGFLGVEEIVRNKEGELLCSDTDHSTYYVKTYFEGHECNIKEDSERVYAIKTLASLHKSMTLPQLAAEKQLEKLPLLHEFEKRNRELKKVRRYLKEKGQKTEFELYLQKNYDSFFNKALEVTEELKSYPTNKWKEELLMEGTFCHGDYQHHNILIQGEIVNLINFEKYVLEEPIRDLYLFTRKLLEKNNWNIDLGKRLIDEYESERELSITEWIQLKFRFLYPEKFWKIVNFYFNNTKAFIPLRNKEKLEKILGQEIAKDEFMEQLIEIK